MEKAQGDLVLTQQQLQAAEARAKAAEAAEMRATATEQKLSDAMLQGKALQESLEAGPGRRRKP